MSRWTVGDVCTTDVVSVRDDTSFLEIVELLDKYAVSGLPVVDGTGRVVGVVSEADLLPKMEFAGESRERRLLEGRRHRIAREKAGGEVARDVMTSPPVTASLGTPVVEAARRMEQVGVKRLPVVDGYGRLVGIVSRHDLLTVFLRTDAAITTDVVAELSEVPGVDPSTLGVLVAEGIVTLTGQVDRRSLVTVVIRLAERVDGVIEVIDRLTYRYNDVEPVLVNIP